MTQYAELCWLSCWRVVNFPLSCVQCAMSSLYQSVTLCRKLIGLPLYLNPFRSCVGPRPTLWFSYSRNFTWSLTLSNPIFLPPAYSPALIYFGQERGWWVTCNYPTVLKEKNRNRKSTTCTICWLKSVLLRKMLDEFRHYDFPVPNTFPHVVWTLAKR
jgi:hypothetical protein